MGSVVAVDVVTRGKELARFVELPQALHGDDPRFAPLLMAWERYRLDVRRNPYFERGEGACFLARRLGRPAGRVAAHVPETGGEGRFGFWWLDDDPDVARALVEAALAWLDERGCTSMTGPLSFTADEEAGVLVEGVDVPGVTGRPWHPPHLAQHLDALGFDAVAERATWRLATTTGTDALPPAEDAPGQAGAYVDRRLVLEGIAAVPDLAEPLRTSGLRSAWALAKRARAGDWDTCTVVRCAAAPDLAVPALLSTAGRAGYRWVIAPWSDDEAPPETVHRTYRLSW